MSHAAIYTWIIFTKFKVADLWYVLTADTLRHAVTFIFDPLTLNVCSVSPVTWSNSVSNFSKITQSVVPVVESLLFQCVQFGGCLPYWIWLEVNCHNSVTSGDTQFTSLSNFNTLSQCTLSYWWMIYQICCWFSREPFIYQPSLAQGCGLNCTKFGST